jgi:proline dehydrogenase
MLAIRSGLAHRFVAGDNVSEALEVVRDLHRVGIATTLNSLGEEVKDEREAEAAAKATIELLRAIDSSSVKSQVSLKLSQLGLRISKVICSAHLEAVLEVSRELGNFIRIDMEGSRYTQATVDLFMEHFPGYGNDLGIVIQSYLYRSAEDVSQLIQLPCNIRLCKGAYREPESIAFARKEDVDRNFIALMEEILLSPSYLAIATHDNQILEHACRFAVQHGIDPDQFEFQMIHGIGREAQQRLRQEGYVVRVYVPFGTEWAPYFVRRLAERPANCLFLLKNLPRN